MLWGEGGGGGSAGNAQTDAEGLRVIDKLTHWNCSWGHDFKLRASSFCFPGHPRTYLQSVPSKLIPQQVKREAVSVLPEQEPDDLAWGYRGLVS